MPRCTEPLAWNIDEGDVLEQRNCPLFSVIPTEIRDLIYEYALTESIFNQPGQVAPNQTHAFTGDILKYDCARHLLLTCKAVYLETYLLPLRLNPMQLPWFDGLVRSVPTARMPWQFATIQSFDITLLQTMLEGDCLYNFLFDPTGWHPEARHKGVLVAPYAGLKNTIGGSYRARKFTLLPTKKDDDIIRLGDALKDMRLPSGFQTPKSNMRLLRARPLVHLTLRMLYNCWWTWADEPDSADFVHHHLGLDPAVGDGRLNVETRPTFPLMQELAQQRRYGHYPGSKGPIDRTTPGWGHTISKLPDLQTLELVLETFKEKTAQLEHVIDCAKTWCFPIAGTQFELVWNGKVESIHWKKPLVENSWARTGDWYSRKTEFEVRIIRFTRRQVS